jgi:hypothetical protein
MPISDEHARAIQAKIDLIAEIDRQLADLELQPMPEEIKAVKRRELKKERERQSRALMLSLATITDKNGKLWTGWKNLGRSVDFRERGWFQQEARSDI